MAQYREYKVISVSEGGCGTLLLGAATLPLKRIEDTLNREAADGWQVVFQVVERQRYMLFWQRDSLVVTLGR